MNYCLNPRTLFTIPILLYIDIGIQLITRFDNAIEQTSFVIQIKNHMNYNLEKYLEKRLSKKDKEALQHKINLDSKFRRELLSRCLLVKSMINIDNEKCTHVISSILIKVKK